MTFSHTQQLVKYLNEYVVGQENAKKVLSVAYVDPLACAIHTNQCDAYPEKRI